MKTIDIVRQVAPRCSPNYALAFENGDTAFADFELTTPLRQAHFLAQVLHETGGGKVLFENLNYTTAKRLLEIFGAGRHTAAIRPEETEALLGNPQAIAERVYGLGNPAKAKELGNLQAGDAFRYRGGGALQTTGGGNYRTMSDKCSVDFYRDPNLIVDAEHVLKPALHEWQQGRLNALADINDIRGITRKINGGYNGIKERQAWFDKIWPLASGSDTEAWAIASADEDTAWLQQALNELGAHPPLVVDGRYGGETTRAVKWFQSVARLKVDGVAGDLTRTAIRLRLNTGKPR